MKRNLFTFFPTFLFVDIHEDDIPANLTDLFPGDDVFRVPAENGTELSGPGDDKSQDAAVFFIDEKIHDAA